MLFYYNTCYIIYYVIYICGGSHHEYRIELFFYLYVQGCYGLQKYIYKKKNYIGCSRLYTRCYGILFLITENNISLFDSYSVIIKYTTKQCPQVCSSQNSQNYSTDVDESFRDCSQRFQESLDSGCPNHSGWLILMRPT